MMKKGTTKLLCALAMFGGASAYAQDAPAVDSTAAAPEPEVNFMELSLEELLNMEVSVASKKAEKISDAPGMITSYSANDIKRYGYYTLKDLANITSGYSSFSAFGETNLETRGQKAGSWNVTKHLLLVDGIPVNHARANSAPLEYQVPLFMADRVEFLKGPGSALYGTSAFYGVMNVTSKDLKENGTVVENRISYGDLGNSMRLMGNAITKTDAGQLKVSFSHFKKGFSGDSLGLANKAKTFNYDNDNSTFLNTSFKFTDTKLKGLSAGMIYMKRNSHAGEFWGATPSINNEVTWEEVIPYLKYNREINEKLTFNSYAKINSSTEKSTFNASWASFGQNSTPFAGYSYTTRDVEALAEVNYAINESSSLIAGLNAYSRSELASPNSFEWGITSAKDTSVSKAYTFYHNEYKGSARVNVASAYAQYQKKFNVLQGLILTAGGRFDNGFSEAGTYSQFSPRVGAVLKTTDKLNFKALFGQALRTPGIKEIQGNASIIDEVKANAKDPSVANNIPTVRPEVIKSFEIGANYNTENLSLALALFNNITTDPLDGTQFKYTAKDNTTSSPNINVNSNGNIVARGIEIDAQYAVSKDLRFMVNHAIAKAMINDTVKFVDVPTQKTNFAATYTLPGKFKLSSTIVARHVWGYTVTEGAYKDAGASGDLLSGYTLMDLNFIVPINDNLGLEAQIRNVLNEEWRQPSLLGQNSMIPLQKRNVMFTLYAKF